MTEFRPALRLASFYAAAFLIVGIQTPFWPVWLAAKGLGVREIATVFAAALWAKVAVTPAIGALADRLGRRRAVMIVLAVASCTSYAALRAHPGSGRCCGSTWPPASRNRR